MKIRHTQLSRFAALLTIAAGAAILIGYFLGAPEWTALGTGTDPVNPLAAAAFIVCGAALWFTVSGRPPVRGLRQTGLFLVTASGLATTNILTGWFSSFLALHGSGITRSIAEGLTGHAAFTDFALAVAFACIGSCTYVLNRDPERIRLWMCLPLIPVFWASYLSITAAFYQVHSLNVYFERTLIPLPAALVFAVFLIGQLASRPDRGGDRHRAKPAWRRCDGPRHTARVVGVALHHRLGAHPGAS